MVELYYNASHRLTRDRDVEFDHRIAVCYLGLKHIATSVIAPVAGLKCKVVLQNDRCTSAYVLDESIGARQEKAERDNEPARSQIKADWNLRSTCLLELFVAIAPMKRINSHRQKTSAKSFASKLKLDRRQGPKTSQDGTNLCCLFLS